MYNIIQLNDKNLSELQVIAKELGIKKADSYKKEDLVYKILDEQAIVGATKKVAADKLKEERKNEEAKTQKEEEERKLKEKYEKKFEVHEVDGADQIGKDIATDLMGITDKDEWLSLIHI